MRGLPVRPTEGKSITISIVSSTLPYDGSPNGSWPILSDAELRHRTLAADAMRERHFLMPFPALDCCI